MLSYRPAPTASAVKRQVRLALRHCRFRNGPMGIWNMPVGLATVQTIVAVPLCMRSGCGAAGRVQRTASTLTFVACAGGSAHGVSFDDDAEQSTANHAQSLAARSVHTDVIAPAGAHANRPGVA